MLRTWFHQCKCAYIFSSKSYKHCISLKILMSNSKTYLIKVLHSLFLVWSAPSMKSAVLQKVFHHRDMGATALEHFQCCVKSLGPLSSLCFDTIVRIGSFEYTDNFPPNILGFFGPWERSWTETFHRCITVDWVQLIYSDIDGLQWNGVYHLGLTQQF